MNYFILKIINNTQFSLDYTVNINGRNFYGIKNNDSTDFHAAFDNEYVIIKISKKNNWICPKKIDRILMYLHSMDSMWGNTNESDNLPIGINYTVKIPSQEINKNYKIQLADIIESTEESIRIWEKGAIIQYATMFFVISLISLFIFIISPIYFKIPLILLIPSVLFLLLYKIRVYHIKVKKNLKKLIKDQS